MDQFIEGVSSSGGKGRRGGFSWSWVLIAGVIVAGGFFFYKKYMSTPPLLENPPPQRQHRPPPPPSRHSMTAHQAYADLQAEMGNGMRSSRKNTPTTGPGPAMPPPPSMGGGGGGGAPAHEPPPQRGLVQPIGISPSALAESGFNDDDKAGIPSFRRNRMDIEGIKATMGGK